MRQVDAVVWDVGRVLVQWDLSRIYRDLIPDPAERAAFTSAVVTEDWHAQHDAGVPLADMVAARSAEYPQHAALIDRYRTHWLESVPGPVEGTHPLVERLTAQGVPQFCITNFGVDTWAMFRPTFPILDHFAEIVVSGAERLVKPDPAIFHLAAGRFDHAPDRMVFIDDNAANVASAAALGWKVHHFGGDVDALEADLKALGVL
ncbi:HAD-IA family hydrolase [Novosphingobium sp. KCTC 2891]|uniref:HAD-IA family hydrolase n=1 Tax=Novosphingobium sp. KCTC 2891 TaxID=2989730 RepID=UPI002222BC85|nr:HAD-IA family hydrolase [Novosphingobium sp. KCTC 2891]MCW1382389.1 HAD-IA family hydrolase [Novosphingobium sp. KCTC 2891]